MRRREFIRLVGSAAIAWPLGTYAQQPESALPKRIGWLSALGCSRSPNNPVSRRLAELGWIEGQSYVVECVSTVGHLDQLSELARELVSRRPDVLTAYPSSFVRALRKETRTIPIIMAGTADPVRNGLVSNLARPEGNVTGVAWFGYEMIPKRIELLREIVPHLRRLALIDRGSDPERRALIDESMASAANALGFAWQRFAPVVVNDYDEIFTRLAAEHFDAAYMQADLLINQPQSKARIIQLTRHHPIPAVGEDPELAKGGLLLTYNQDLGRTAERGAEYVDKLLRGARPGELPIEQATDLQLVINLKTAKALGLTVPPSLIARADEVIE
jgi:putative tryptophan/tyrosine transport system substrate-binding protein